MNQEESKKEKPEEKNAVKPKLGREAKIGVSVILLLLVVLGGVLVVKLMGGSTDEKINSIADRDAGKGKRGGEFNDPMRERRQRDVSARWKATDVRS